MRKIEAIFQRLGSIRNYPAGKMLFSAGEAASGLYYVEKGEIRIYRMDSDGREAEVVRLEAGDILGEAIVFTGNRYPFFAEAVRESRVIFLSRESLFEEIDKVPSSSLAFLRLLSEKCLTLNRKIESLGMRTIRQRLILFLLARCPGDRKCLVELDLKKGELARKLGTVGETLSRNLRQLQDDGLVRVEGRRIHILNCQALRNEVGDPGAPALSS